MPLKVGIDISQIAYPGTGVATYTENLVSSLLRVDKENEYILFYSSLRRSIQNSKFSPREAGKIQNCNSKLKSFRFPPTFLEFLWNRVHVLPIEKIVGDIDVFHTSDWLEPPARCPKVTTIHDMVVYKYPQTLHPKIVINQKRKLEWVKKESKLIIAVSKSTKQDIVDILKIPPAKIKVVYEACDPLFEKASKEITERVKQKYGISGQYILAVGTREPRKNLERVLEAHSLLVKSYPDISLVIAGKYGWGKDIEKFKIQNSRLAKRAKFKILGFVPKEDLPALYTGSECFVYPSLYEGFGLPILEAMNCGSPVVTSNLPCMQEIAENSAVLVDPENIEGIVDGIRKAIKNRDVLIKKGYERVKQFSWEKTAKETIKVYKETVEL